MDSDKKTPLAAMPLALRKTHPRQAVNKMSKTAWRKNQTGEVPVGEILIIGLIAIPLVITLILFREDAFTWLIDQWVNFVVAGQA